MRALATMLLLTLAVPASAQPRHAPLPPGLQPSGEAGERGMYAETAFGLVPVNARLAALEETCGAKGAPVKIEGRKLLTGKKMIFRTGRSVAIFEDRPDIIVDEAACTARVSHKRRVMARSGEWEKIRPSDWSAQPLSCPRRSRSMSRCSTADIAGVKAFCVDWGDGFMGGWTCLSQQDDLSRNLVLRTSEYSDDGSIPEREWAMDLVRADILIDPVVFRSAGR